MPRCWYLDDDMDELKISDLSVGDWVLFTGCPRRVAIISSTCVLPHKCVLDIATFSIGDISPIPITPEILEKNGISKTYESDEYAVYKGEGFNVTEYYTELWEFEKHRNRMKIRNVHQLQHALRLAGIDKEIEL